MFSHLGTLATAVLIGIWNLKPVIPFEFIIAGPPISQQTRNRARLQTWKRDVYQAAATRWPSASPPTNGMVKLTITYYYETTAPDVDNIIKPIQEALISLVYADDRQVTDAVSRKRNLNGSFRVRGMSSVLAEGFCTGKEFIHIKVDVAPDPKDLD